MAITAPKRRTEETIGGVENGLRESLVQRRRARQGRQIGFRDWVGKVPEPKTGPLNFALFPFQKELYDEGVNEKEAVVKKATQVGVSAWAMRWAFYHCDTRGLTGLYVFPTAKDMYDYSTLRVKPLIDASPYLRERRKPDDPDNKGMKGVGLGVVVFRGSESKTGLDSVDADHIVFDEYDTLDQDNIPDAEMRVSSPLSPGLIRRVGVPIFPDAGIDESFNASDRRRWMVKCEHCNRWQVMNFWKNVDMKTAQRVCADCRKPINVADGEWVPEITDGGRHRGYHISRLIVPTADLKNTIVMSKKRSPAQKQVFMNKHLGEAWVPAEGRLSREAIKAAQREYLAATTMAEARPVSAELVTMGVDVATVRDLNVRISSHFMEGGVEKKRALYIGMVEGFEDVDKLMQIYGVHMCVIDHLPDGRLAMGVAHRHPGRAYLVSYDSQPLTKSPQVLTVDDEMHHARVNRVFGIDAAFDSIRYQSNLLPANLPDGYVEQMSTPLRVFEEDEFGKKRLVYRSPANKPDDYAHAEVYDVVAKALWDRRQTLDELLKDEDKPLDEMLEFDRSTLAHHTGSDGEYHQGPSDEDYYGIGD